MLSYAHVLSNKLEHYNFLDFEVTVKNPKEKMAEIREVLSMYDLEIVKISVSDEDTKKDMIRIVAKYKEQLDVNKLITKILEIDKVTGVVEVK